MRCGAGADPQVRVIEQATNLGTVRVQSTRAMTDLGIRLHRARADQTDPATHVIIVIRPSEMSLVCGCRRVPTAGSPTPIWPCDGFIIDPDLRVTGTMTASSPWAIAHMPFAPPKAGAFAWLLFCTIIYAQLKPDAPMRRFRPQKSLSRAGLDGCKVAMANMALHLRRRCLVAGRTGLTRHSWICPRNFP
jgi:hypothetical protein